MTTGMHVPEAAVDVDNLSQLRQNDIGRAGKVAAMQAESVSQGMDQPPDFHFRLRVARSHRRHNSRSLCLGDSFAHESGPRLERARGSFEDGMIQRLGETPNESIGHNRKPGRAVTFQSSLIPSNLHLANLTVEFAIPHGHNGISPFPVAC